MEGYGHADRHALADLTMPAPKLAEATFDRPLAPAGGAPEWVHLLPEGDVTARDGREFKVYDPGAVVLRFQEDAVDLVVDYEHQAARPDSKGPVPAAGWIKELKAAEGGLWGRVEWTATARQMIEEKEYRYISPWIVFHEKTRQVLRLKGAGLVHNPALHLTALASQETPMQRIAALLKLSADAGEDAICAKVEELLAAQTATLAQAEPDPAKYVPIDQVQAMLREENEKRAAGQAARVQRKVDDALKSGHLARPLKDWAVALCSRDEAAFDDFLAGGGSGLSHLTRTLMPGGAPPVAARAAESAEADAICAMLGLKPGSLKD